MAVYAGKTKLPQGDIFDILEGSRYFGPPRGVGIGLGTGLGLGALFSKGKEKEKKIDISDDDIFTQEEKDILNKLPPGLRESMGESLKGQKEKLTKTLQEEKEALKGLLKKVSEDPRNEKSFPEDMIDAAADAIIKSSLKKMEEGLSKKQAIGESWKEVYETLTSGGLTKQARGGLIGINELTRGL